ncbi:MAG: hypothetical protein ACPK7O_06765 [Methanobacterium sp.]
MIKIHKKLIYIKPEQKTALNEIKDTVSMKGGSVSAMRLVQDAIQIFTDHYREEAIQRYSSNYAKK